MADYKPKTLGRVHLELERFAGKESDDPLDPKRFKLIEIKLSVNLKFVKEPDVSLHVSNAATTRSATFLRQNTHDAISKQYLLNCSRAEARNLSGTLCRKELNRVDGKLHRSGLIGHDQRNR